MRFSNLAIRTKLLLIIGLITFVALLLAISVQFLYERHTAKQTIAEEIGILAKVIADRSTAAMMFNDQKVASENLAALSVHANIDQACLYTSNNTLFTHYSRKVATGTICPTPPIASGFEFSTDFLDLAQPVTVEDNHIGTLFIRVNLKSLTEQMIGYVTVAILTLFGAIILVFLSAVYLQKLISEPIHDLAEIATRVTDTKDFKERAKKTSNDETGQLAEAFNTMLDVVCERDTRLRTLIQTIPDLVWLKDPNGIYLFCNSKFERFFGAREKNIIGKTDYDFVDKKLADFFREKDKAAVAKGNFSINEEEIVYANDGHRELVETIKTPIYDNAGDLIGVLGIARDITKRRQAEKERVKLESQLQQAQKMEAIGTLAGGIAHDFNNLLGVILGFAEMAQDQAPEDSLIHADLDKVLSAGHRAKDLVAQILAFSRQTKSEQIHLHPQPILKEAIKLIRSSIPTTISVEQNIEDGCGAIKADPTQLHQIIMNLCTNSYQAMEEHGGILSITLDRTELTTDDLRDEPSLIPGSYVQLTIADTGPGINPDIQKHIFDPYFTTKEVGKGTGLGLSVVHGIVKNHGGMISADSKVGEGTTFHVFFPELIEMIEENVVAAHSMPTGNERILFVDDERLLADMGKQLLERSGYSVTALTSSREALEMFRAQPDQFDLVITDQTMPGLTGVNLAQAIFAIQQNMPIILCTGYSTTISKKKALAMGIREFVMKPMLKNDIAPLIRKVLDEVKAEKTNKAYDF